MNRAKRFLLAALSLVVLHGYGQCSVATAAGVGSSGVSGLRTHDHSSASKGGAALSGTTLSAPTLSGTVTMSGTPTLSGAFIVTATVSSTKACAAGYTRVGPNFCLRTGSITVVALTRDACTSITPPDSGAKALLLHVNISAKSGNAADTRFAAVQTYDNAACTTGNSMRSSIYAREDPPVAAGTDLAVLEGTNVMLVTASNYVIFVDDAGNQGAGNYLIQGYWD